MRNIGLTSVHKGSRQTWGRRGSRQLGGPGFARRQTRPSCHSELGSVRIKHNQLSAINHGPSYIDNHLSVCINMASIYIGKDGRQCGQNRQVILGVFLIARYNNRACFYLISANNL